MQILRIYKRPQFLTLYMNSMWWEVNAHVIYVFFRKIHKIQFCIDMNSNVLPAVVLRSPMTTSDLTCSELSATNNQLLIIRQFVTQFIYLQMHGSCIS